MSMINATGKQRKDRPLAALNRSILSKIAHCPSSSAAFTTTNGRAIRQSFARDICRVMTVLVDEMCFHSNKVGVATVHGFSLRTWGFIAEAVNLPLWRVKQCVKYAFQKGWITSKQPRERYTGKDNRDQWRGLASIKRVTETYFKDLGIYEQYQEAKTAAKQWLKMLARRLQRPVKYIQTPITLLRRRRKEAAINHLPQNT
ncbi:hypothetical protein [Vibrio gazogenes]|uniref:Uncharacterized protein n=1 Tax=Vibrio gazogenes TaxID=687 RepID=A0A1Z2SB80_VIBGA|nr:hypothetical protein [Vibrio gazogenes]ASA54432.1 hypothetical protein BSQ33_00945 [Vibrio gazogenes]ASA58364.1 hypothetical protein BSQ33_21530 [Vibrio gazogenes]